jgi:hypothetical protein
MLRPDVHEILLSPLLGHIDHQNDQAVGTALFVEQEFPPRAG